MFVLLDQTNEMRSYEAVFGDLEGRRLVCIKRHLTKQFWKDGYYLCTYQPNYRGQAALTDRDVDNKRVYPFSYVQVGAMKGRFFYRLFNNNMQTGPPRMMAENPWLGFMVVCCSTGVRLGKWTAQFKKSTTGKTTISVDQWRNTVDVGPGNDLLAALCMAYIFDRYQCNPFITVFGRDSDDEYEPSDKSISSSEEYSSDEDEEAEKASLKPDKQPPIAHKKARENTYGGQMVSPKHSASPNKPAPQYKPPPAAPAIHTQAPYSAQNESESDDASVEVPLTSENIGSLRNNLLPVSNTAPWDDLSTVNGGTTVHSAATRDTQQSSATKKSQYGQQLEPSEIV